MNQTSLPAYIENSLHEELEQVREQSFTFSKNNHNPELSPNNYLNKIQVEQDSNNDQNHFNKEGSSAITKGIQTSPYVQQQDRTNRSTDPKRKELITPPRKQSTSLTPNKKQSKNQIDDNQSLGSEDEAKNYQGLTMKLETALKKISHSRATKTEGSETVWKRLEECGERKKKELQLKRQENEKLKSRHYKDKPTINKNSQKLVREVGYEPIYTRYEKLMELKKKKEEELEESKRRQKEIQEEMYLEQLQKHMKKPEHVRNYDKYYEEMKSWKEKKEKINRQKFEEKQAKELEGATFKPTLCKKSQQMVSSQTRIPISERGLIKKKTAEQFSFTPNIGRKR